MSDGISRGLRPKEATAFLRTFRRSGGTVRLTTSNHLLWELPDGRRHRTGLTMRSRSWKCNELLLRRMMGGGS